MPRARPGIVNRLCSYALACFCFNIPVDGLDDGQSVRRRFAVTCIKGCVRRGVGSSSGCTFRSRSIERNPLDCTGKDRRTDAATTRAALRLDGYADFIIRMIKACLDITLHEMVECIEGSARCASAGAP